MSTNINQLKRDVDSSIDEKKRSERELEQAKNNLRDEERKLDKAKALLREAESKDMTNQQRLARFKNDLSRAESDERRKAA